jgi:hypothetical protein
MYLLRAGGVHDRPSGTLQRDTVTGLVERKEQLPYKIKNNNTGNVMMQDKQYQMLSENCSRVSEELGKESYNLMM